ncbi:MAG: DNA-binding response regulator [Leptolyngbya sp. PLA3]|nr:MAG: DNA-binding response regulator [Cyanobacteria bacterium CYA]MCE7967338.1 DNA-binding response regulator [Leptolyngbya sp. PL-A3]
MSKMLRDTPLILVVDDEPHLVELLAYNIRAAGYDVETALDGKKALERIAKNSPDLVLLDLMIPLVPGLAVAQRIRESDATKHVPIIMLTARGENADQVRGLRAGADDYITKPFSIELLLARIEAVLRRSNRAAEQDNQTELSLGSVRVDTRTFQAYVEQTLLTLTATEFRLLAALLKGEGRVLSRKELIAAAMGPGVTITERTIDVHMTAIRRKLGDDGAMIRTVRGVGYRAVSDEAKDEKPREAAH